MTQTQQIISYSPISFNLDRKLDSNGIIIETSEVIKLTEKELKKP